MVHERTTAIILFAVCLALPACDENTSSSSVGKGGPYESEVPEGIGAAVMLLIDTSGSMGDPAPGGAVPKWKVARDAIGKMLEATDAFSSDHPGHRIRVGVMHFADRPNQVLGFIDYDEEQVRAALARVPRPKGGTAIGVSLDAARREIYRSGCHRKYILVITDGENTAGIAPESAAREIHRRSEGGVRIYFVAFDTDPAKFAFLKEVGGDVVSAQSEAQLGSALKEIYEGRILVEAMEDVPPPIEKR